MTTSGSPQATLSESGALPLGITFTASGDDTARLVGTAGAGSQGTHTITLSASNGLTPATQTFTLTILATSMWQLMGGQLLNAASIAALSGLGIT